MDTLVVEGINTVYRDRIMNLFVIDGVEDFSTAIELNGLRKY